MFSDRAVLKFSFWKKVQIQARNSIPIFQKRNGRKIDPCAVRKPLPQIAGDDALNPLIDFLDALLGAYAQPCAGQQAKAKGRQQTQRQRLTDDMGDFAGLIDISSEDEDVAISHAPRDRTDSLKFATFSVCPDDIGALRGCVDPQMRWQAFQITGYPVTVGRKYRHDLYPPGILPQLLIDCLQPAFRRQAGNGITHAGEARGFEQDGQRSQIAVVGRRAPLEIDRRLFSWGISEAI